MGMFHTYMLTTPPHAQSDTPALPSYEEKEEKKRKKITAKLR